ncbi:MAG: HipA domain-containing protein [Bdellovibrio sp.]
MTSKLSPQSAFVWMWLPGETSPVIAGRLVQDGPTLKFNYGKSYLERTPKISLYTPELPLKAGSIEPLPGLKMPGCIRDGAPDAWGRRVIINRKYGKKGDQIDSDSLSELSYLLESGSDRIGALDFQSSETYKPRDTEGVSLEALMQAADLVERGLPLPLDLDKALYHGTAIGGARPKALINEEERKYIAKFSSTSDTYSVIKAEYIAMRLAALAGLKVANVKQVKAAHKDVLLIERFDRVKVKKGWARKSIISVLTMLHLDENVARYASYQDLAEIIRQDFDSATPTLKELFSRIVFNILCGNTDDHARNHAAFWNGSQLSLTPAYDICPQTRTGGEVNQAMSILGQDRRSQLSLCLEAAEEVFMLSRNHALEIIEHITKTIRDNWSTICQEAEVSPVDESLFKSRQFFNPYAFEGLDGSESHLIKHLHDFKKS